MAQGSAHACLATSVLLAHGAFKEENNSVLRKKKRNKAVVCHSEVAFFLVIIRKGLRAVLGHAVWMAQAFSLLMGGKKL